MSLFQKLVLKIGDRKLRRIKDLSSHPLYHSYLKYHPVIEKKYKEADYWHGTGRFHYHLLGDSKYEDVDTTKIYDVLESVIEKGGLVPKHDAFIKVDGKLGSSVSLTPYRMYARAYAEFNMPEGKEYEYVFGTTKFWYYLLMPLQISEWGLTRSFKTVRGLKEYNMSNYWFKTFRKQTNWTVKDFYKTRSDIPENYGILFGIKKTGVDVVHIDPSIERFETRAGNLIKLEDITHIEVPLDKVDETKRMLVKCKVNFPVIPLEIGELYCNRFTLKELSGVS